MLRKGTTMASNLANDTHATARPWRVEEFGEVSGADRTLICSTRGGANGEANRELIVRAVNAHDAMRDALRDLVDDCRACDGKGHYHGVPCAVCRPGRKALALADGTATP